MENEWLDSYHRKMKVIEKHERQMIEEKLLKDLKKKHYLEKKNEIEKLKEKLKELEKEISCYK
jgi:hypothetical protein